jgi:hypothetical protein
MAEAMAFGRPVIATGYSGNLEFMTAENSYLVPYRLTKIPNRCDPYPAGTEWAEPDVEAAARLMRYVYDNPDEAEARGRRAREDIHDHHSPQETASFITDRIATIRRTTVLATTRDVAALAESAQRPRKAMERAERYITDGPENRLNSPSKLRAVGRLYRRLLFRLLRPYAVRQREFELAVVEAIGDVQREVATDIETTAERHSDALHGVDQRLNDGVQRQIERLSRLETRSDDLSRGLEELRASVTENTAAPSTPVSRLRAPHDVSEPALLGTTDASDGEAIGYNSRKKARQ